MYCTVSLHLQMSVSGSGIMRWLYPFTRDEYILDPEMGVSIDYEVNVSIHLEMSICDPEMGDFIDPVYPSIWR